MTTDEQQRLTLHAQGYTAKQMAVMLRYSHSGMIDWHKRRGLVCNGGSGRGGLRRKGVENGQS